MTTDRYQTKWTGPLHPIALRWASQHRISLIHPGGLTIRTPGSKLKPSDITALTGGIQLPNQDFSPSTYDRYISIPGPPGSPILDIRDENRKYNEELKAHHTADTDLSTGTSGFIRFIDLNCFEDESNIPGPEGHKFLVLSPSSKIWWEEASRGEKLRENKLYGEAFENGLVKGEKRKGILISSITNVNTTDTGRGNINEKRCLELVDRHLVLLRKLKGLNTGLRDMIWRELDEGWMWREEIDLQKGVRREMHGVELERHGLLRCGLVTIRDWEHVLDINLFTEGMAAWAADGLSFDISGDWPKGLGLL